MDIKVKVKITKDHRDVDVKFQGFNENLVSHEDRKMFQISNKKRVKEAIDKLKSAEEQVDGIIPVAAVTTCHTPLGSFFASYSWYDVTRKVKPFDWKIIGTETSTEIIDSKTHFNNTDCVMSINIELMHNHEQCHNTIAVTDQPWFDSIIDYNFLLPVIPSYPVHTAAATNISYQCCGEDTVKGIPVKHSFRAMMELEPGAQIVANLQVTRHTYELEMIYEASMKGDITAKFISCFKRYKNDYCVNDVLQAAGLPTTVFRSQIIKIIIYTDREIVIT